MPSATLTTWNPAGVNLLWSNAANWTAGLPTSSTIAVFDNSVSIASCTYDNSVQAANQTVAGIQTLNGYPGALYMTGGLPLTVSSLSTDNTTGFRWSSGTISQSSTNDVLVITGGGSASNNYWSGGTIANLMAQSNIYINGYSTLQITGSASNLGDNITVGEDGNGGCTLQLHNQTQTLNVTNNAGIEIADTCGEENGPNQLVIDTNVTTVGMVAQGLSTSSSNSFIDNYGTIVRSNAGTFQTGLPIRNEASSLYPATLDLKSSLYVSGSSESKTAGWSVDQEGGITILENGSTLQVSAGMSMSAGGLDTYGGSTATIRGALSVSGGTIEVSADNPSAYGTLNVTGNMTWTGGTFQAYVNGATANQQTQLTFGVMSTVTVGSGAHLSINVIGTLTSGLSWQVISYNPGSWSGALTFDSGLLFTLSANQTTVTSL